MSRPREFARSRRVAFTAEQLERLEREAALRNTTVSEVVRECVDKRLGIKKKGRTR